MELAPSNFYSLNETVVKLYVQVEGRWLWKNVEDLPWSGESSVRGDALPREK